MIPKKIGGGLLNNHHRKLKDSVLYTLEKRGDKIFHSPIIWSSVSGLSVTLVPGKTSFGSTTCIKAEMKFASLVACKASFLNWTSAPQEMSPFKCNSSKVLDLQLRALMFL